uniref:Endonuclease/exonuclease/phosphatase domain-containing protein n=1 Tax=Homalodisca liturata TaxID=320908 RepID=A0A1B6K5N1_9HEMI
MCSNFKTYNSFSCYRFDLKGYGGGDCESGITAKGKRGNHSLSLLPQPFNKLPTIRSRKITAVLQRERGAALILGCDCNAHHTFLGSTNTNPRVEKLLQFMFCNDLVLENRESSTTFITRTRKEVLNVILYKGLKNINIVRWHISQEASLLGHCPIRFYIEAIGEINVTTGSLNLPTGGDTECP